MNAKARTAQQTIKARRLAAKAAKASHTLKSHALRSGLEDSLTGSVAGALRAKGKTVGITGCPVRMFRTDARGVKLWRQPVKNARRYTKDEFLALAQAYAPRAAKLVAAREALLSY